MARNLVGITSAGSALPDTEMSTEANDLTAGFERINPVSTDARQQLAGVPDGSGGSVNLSMPSDLQGPNGFNMARNDEAAQSIVTNINDAGMDKPSPSFSPFDAPFSVKTSAGDNASAKDGLNDLGNDAQGDKPSY
jgi:hypothetical protein